MTAHRLALVLPNQADFFLRNPSYTVGGAAREQLIRFGGSYECEHAIAWTNDPRVLVLPHGYHQIWFADLHQQWNLQLPPVITPQPASGLLIKDLLADPAAMRQLREAVSQAELIDLLCYGPTPEVYRLADQLTSWGHQVGLDSVDRDHYWASSWLETKLSCPDLARIAPGITVADTVVVSDRAELAGVAQWMLDLHHKILVRTPFGVAGDGTTVLTDTPGAVAAMSELVEQDPFFVFPLLVQRFVPHSDGVGCPAADILITEEGAAEIVTCALTVEQEHLFRSVNVGPGALPKPWADRLHRLARRVGETVAGMGYRGWLCIDCVAGADGQLYLTEINARRSGSTFAGSLLREWSAGGPLTLSADFMVPMPPGTDYQRDIRPHFVRRWERGERVYPTTVRGLGWPEPIMAIMAAGRTAAEAEQLVRAVTVDLHRNLATASASDLATDTATPSDHSANTATPATR